MLSVLLMPGRTGSLTSLLRTMPDFLVIGMAKSGTTSLYGLITAHPDVLPARVKETYYFSDPAAWQGRNMLWYRGHFPTVLHMRYLSWRHGRKILSGEASSSYLFWPEVPGRVRAALPDVRLIAILRNPVDRAYSEYGRRVRERRESRTFEDAIAAEDGMMSHGQEKDAPKPARHDPRIYPYLGRSHYAEQLGRWFDHFDRDRLLILTLEELEADRQGVLDRVFGFLGLEQLDTGLLGNVSDSWVRQFEPDPSRPVDPGLLNVASYPAMNPETRRMLLDHFRPHNERLSALLGGGRLDWDR